MGAAWQCSVEQMRGIKKVRVSLERLSAWDFEYAVNLAIAALITYALITSVTPLLLNRSAEAVGVVWAVISAIFVVRDTREHSLSAGISRLVATCASFALCMVYLLFFSANPLGMAVLIGIGTLLVMLVGRRDEISLVAITTAVIFIVASENQQAAWQQPLLRLADSVVGVAIGIACKWIASFLSFHVRGQHVRQFVKVGCDASEVGRTSPLKAEMSTDDPGCRYRNLRRRGWRQIQ
jgi:hypothetical protein